MKLAGVVDLDSFRLTDRIGVAQRLAIRNMPALIHLQDKPVYAES
jgi:hypothetical protein